MPPHLFSRWDAVAALLREAPAIRLFLDFDGTLAPVCAKAEDAALSDATRFALGRLARRRDVSVTIVSGRRRHDVRARVSVPRVQCWGLFGWEQRGGVSLPSDARLALERARHRLETLLDGVPGVSLEDKTFGLAVHVRRKVPGVRQLTRRRVRVALAGTAPALWVLPGRDVWNVLPRQMRGKGYAVAQALDTSGTGGLPVYIGDDATDEPAFGAIRQGITVRVGVPRHTLARYRLANPAEVGRFINRLDGSF